MERAAPQKPSLTGRPCVTTRRTDLLVVGSLVALFALRYLDMLCGLAYPTGGDKGSFQFGLMAAYGSALAEGALPWWNAAWGYGFPQVAESQTGVFYPPHLVLYSLLDWPGAFRANYLLHRLALPVTTYLSLRGLGRQPLGAWVGALAFAGGGFALTHVDHQWAVESLVWTPPIWWATLAYLDRGRRLAAVLLPVLIAVQLGIGHFQLCFVTLVGAGVLTLLTAGCGHDGLAGRARLVRPLVLLAAVGCGFGLMAMQLLPTALLTAYIRTHHADAYGIEYLSTHAAPLWTAAGYLWPNLYHAEPLWRHVVWTPARTSPEETLQYVGLLPLALACGAAWRLRQQIEVTRWSVLAVVGVLLAAGPYLPGFATLASLPGLGFFRSWARWSLLTSGALAMLAAYGADVLRQAATLRKWAVRLTAVGMIVGLLVAGWWLYAATVAIGDRDPVRPLLGAGAAGQWYDAHLADTGRRLRQRQSIFEGAGGVALDPAEYDKWLRSQRHATPVGLADSWGAVLRQEVLPTALMMLALAAVCWLWAKGDGSRAPTIPVVVLCVFDMLFFGAAHLEGRVPAAVVDGDETTAWLRDLPSGTRIRLAGNLPLAFGVAQVDAYRTLTIPLPSDWPARILGRRPQSRTGIDAADGLFRTLAGVRWDGVLGPQPASAPVPAGVVRTAAPAYAALEGRPPAEQFGRLQNMPDLGYAATWTPGARTPPVVTYANPDDRLDYETLSADATDDVRPVPIGFVVPAGVRRVVFGATYAPGWSMGIETVVGVRERKMQRFGGFWQAADLDGERPVRFVRHYRPPGRSWGVRLSVGFLCAWLLAVGVVLLRRRPADASR